MCSIWNPGTQPTGLDKPPEKYQTFSQQKYTKTNKQTKKTPILK